jgi:hypothetical protein
MAELDNVIVKTTLNVTKGGIGLLEKFDADQRTLAPDGNAIRAMRASERVPWDFRVTSAARIVRIAKVAFPRNLIGFADIRFVRCEAVNAPTLNITQSISSCDRCDAYDAD